MQVKIFSGKAGTIESQINDWLVNVPGPISITAITQSSSGYALTVAMWFVKVDVAAPTGPVAAIQEEDPNGTSDGSV